MKSLLLKDDWMSNALGKPSYSFRYYEGYTEETINSYLNKCASGSFVSVKIPTQDVASSIKFQNAGFRIVDTLIEHKRLINSNYDSLQNNSSMVDGLKIRKAVNSDAEAVGALAKESFYLSRFHLDPEISNETACNIKQNWSLNFFNGSRGDEMFIAELCPEESKSSEIVGFILIKYGIQNSAPKKFFIDLIAVDKAYKRMGIAKLLIDQLLISLEDNQMVLVGTQAANIPANKLYQGMGFSISDSQFVLHYHN